MGIKDINHILHQAEKNSLMNIMEQNQKNLYLFQTMCTRTYNKGRITIHKGGGHKRRYRLIDFKRNKFNIPGQIASIEYDPNRNANIALVNYSDGEKRYILHPEKLTVGSTIMSGLGEIKLNSLPLANIPLGTDVHNIELFPGKGGQLVRAVVHLQKF